MPVKNAARHLRTVFGFLYRLNPQPDKYIFLESDSEDDSLDIIKHFKRPNELYVLSFSGSGKFDKIAQTRQELLRIARAHNPDYVLLVDSDIFIKTKNIIDILKSRSTDITGGAYGVLYEGKLCCSGIWKENGKYIYSTMPNTSFDNTVLAVGTGCMMVNNKVIMDKRVNFYPLPTNKGEDVAYCEAAKSYGYSIGIDASVDVNHTFSSQRNKQKDWIK